jgi:hypothetical protein
MGRISLFAKSAAFTAVVIPLLYVLSLGRYERAEHWLSDVYFAKEYRAGRIFEPKVIIVSGSNSLFGFDSKTLEQLIGKPVINLAGHAGLSLQFHIKMAEKFAKVGDLVVMPLELGYYAATPNLSSRQVANMSSWGARYLDWSPGTMLSYFRHSSFTSLLTRTLIRRIPSNSQEDVIKTVEANSAVGALEWHGYSYKSMSSRGDILLISGPQPQIALTDDSYTNGEVSDFAIQQLKSLQAHLMDRGASLVLTWPVTMRNQLFDLSKRKDQMIVQSIKNRLSEEGLPIICDPDAFHFERRFFLEASYHINAEAAERRMEALAACMTKGNS